MRKLRIRPTNKFKYKHYGNDEKVNCLKGRSGFDLTDSLFHNFQFARFARFKPDYYQKEEYSRL